MNKDLTFWLSHIEQKHNPNIIDLSLERILPLAKELNITDFPCRVVTVTGTNGKGSCVACLESIALTAGMKVAAYTSPHILEFNERIRINGKNIDDKRLCEAFSVIEERSKNIMLTYFEFTTLAALYIFRNTPLDLLILEVGLGGRLDATNVVNNDLAIITNISIEHKEYLGDTREQIAYEKAGIMRRGKPVICGDPNPPANLPAYANEILAIYYNINDNFYLELPGVNLPRTSALCATAAMFLLFADVAIEQVIDGLQRAQLLGRWQRFTEPCEIIIDVAHNPAAAEYIAEKLAAEPKKTTNAIVGILKDKDITGVLTPLIPHINNWYIAPLPTERSASAKDIAKNLQQLGVNNYSVHKSVKEAYGSAIANCSKNDRLLAYGSFYTVGEVLSARRK